MTQPYRPGMQDMVARQMAQKAADANQAVVAVLTPSTGSANVGALSLGASTTVTVPISPAIPGAAFFPIPVLYASASLLGGLQLGGIVSQTDTTVSVLVRAPLVAVAAGAALQVTCFRTA